jgi:hypothetical protein
MELVSHSLKWLFWGNFWIAFGASSTAYYFCSTYFAVTHIESTQYTLIVFFSTLSVYTAHRILKHSKEENCYTPRHFWVHNNKLVLFWVTVFSLIGAFFLVVVTLSSISLLLLIPMSLVMVVYPPIVKKFKGIRSIPLIKNLTITSVWTGLLLLVPYVNFGSAQPYILFNLLLMGFGFFVLALTLPFDVRDMTHDTITTLGNRFSRRFNKLLSVSCLALSAVLLYLGQCGYIVSIPMVGMVIVLIENQKWKETYYDIFIDGLFILFGVMVLF